MLQTQKQLPVSAEFHGGDDWSSPGIDFSDYSRMATHERKLAPGRRFATPAWAVNNDVLQEIIVRYVEARAFGGPQHSASQHALASGSVQERLRHAQARLDTRRPFLIQTLNSLCKQLVFVKQHVPLDEVRVRQLHLEIENHDTQLRVNGCIAAKVASVIHFYYRMGMSSPNVAAELNLKPPHVRLILWRCWQFAQEMGYKPEKQDRRQLKPEGAKPKARIGRPQGSENGAFERIHREEVCRLHLSGLIVPDIAARLGFPNNQNRIRRILRNAGIYKPARIHRA